MKYYLHTFPKASTTDIYLSLQLSTNESQKYDIKYQGSSE